MNDPTTVLHALGTALAMNLLLPYAASAHPGGLNSQGCHNNRKTGDYHCHRAPAPTTQRATQAAAMPAQAASSVARPPASPTCYTGPRGGTYTITASGKKNYSGC